MPRAAGQSDQDNRSLPVQVAAKRVHILVSAPRLAPRCRGSGADFTEMRVVPKPGRCRCTV